MKIIFLDIDGVLNSVYSVRINSNNGIHPRFTGLPFPLHVEALNKITDATDAKIVVSSTWRKLHSIYSIEYILYLSNVKGQVLDITPIIHNKERGDEIQKWLDKSIEDIESFVILDDDSDMVHLMDHLVKISDGKGLVEADADKAIFILNKMCDKKAEKND